MDIFDIIIAISITFIIGYILDLIWKNNIKNKSYSIVNQKFQYYQSNKKVIFEVVHPLAVRCNPDLFCAIYGKKFFINKEEYEIDSSLTINYHITPFFINVHEHVVYIYVNDQKYILSSLRISFQNVLAFIVIIYMIQNNINVVDIDIIDRILQQLKKK